MMSKTIFSFLGVEVFFAIFLLSGDIKALINTYQVGNLPDITLVCTVILSLVLLFNYKNIRFISREAYTAISLLLIFYIFMIFSLIYTSSDNYSIQKTIYFSLSLLSIILPIVIKNFNINKFMYIFSFIIFFITILYFKFLWGYINGVFPLGLNAEQIILSRGQYLTLSYLNGIIILYYFFNINLSNWRFVFVIISSLFLLLLGGRGPLIFILFIFLFYFLQRFFLFLQTLEIKKFTIISIILFFIIILLILINDSVLLDRTINRFSVLIGGESANVRFIQLSFSLELINNKPIFGYGIGSFGYEYVNTDISRHPHNIFLEIWFELGLFAMILFLFFELTILKSIIESKCYWCLALYIYFILNTLKAGSLMDIRILMGFFGIFLMIYTKSKEYKIESS